ncbi:hypothetical protein SAMN05421641_10777 [Paracoccus thiocyanatus]|uniref:Uncharacterized protein n=1 Tax=Paracoccus thiocyanatus TaxID=34006 RepID=A0A1N6SDZ0_9RHOB|nr:hypothetical protein [Paracoccus thiocyanatus]SIQ39353.1 hypothetical protein SAMN05421641_10777 [Paracoccus thiocyanatus]
MKATHDETTFTLTGEIWSATYPLDELPKWLRWYRSRKARFPKAGNSYDATIAALEGLAGELGYSAFRLTHQRSSAAQMPRGPR